MNDITIYPARRIITMNPSRPFAEAVAVQDGKVLGVGSRAELARGGEVMVKETFADHVLTPGFVEAHSHVMAGGVWDFTYVGYFERRDTQGKLWAGCRSLEAVLERLGEAEQRLADSDEVLIGWGLDPIYLDGVRLVGEHLDRVSPDRQIFVYHASGHLATVNAAVLEAEEITAANPTPGIVIGADGAPNGELQEPAAMSLAATAWKLIRRSHGTEQAKWNYAAAARNTGHTFLADLGGSPFHEAGINSWRSATSSPSFPARVMVAASTVFSAVDPVDMARQVTDLQKSSGGKLYFGIIKIILDGSIQGFTARLSWPHYTNAPEGAAQNGLWLVAPEQLNEMVEVFHRAGLTVHCHCNGDEAAEVFIDAVEAALEAHPRWDHRHTVQHSQLTTKAQYKRMHALGMCANLFSNHIFYWGDQHVEFTVGAERAAGMNGCATAEREGVSFSFHSDAPITPLGHLHVMWCAVNRITATGEILGSDERISVELALHAATLGAAYQLKVDHLVGSIEAGKLADFAVLDADPYEVDPGALKDIGVWGTVLGGVPQPASRRP